MSETRNIEAENLWISEHANAAELFFGKTENDTLTQDEDEKCFEYAQMRVDEFLAGF
jgi:hypothetical protein